MSLVQTPFGFASTAAEVAAGVELRGHRVIVTGGSSGIGVETVRALAGTGAEVTLAVRDVAAGQRTAAGWELQFATNHLGHFALTTGLHDALAADGAARIVSVSSSGHQISPVIFDDLHFAFRPYDPWLAYGQSKTANVLFAVEATRRWAGDGITANALMPGAVYTNLQRYTGGKGSGQTPADQFKTVQQGAATSLLLAGSPQLEGVGGRYFVDCAEAETVDRRTGTLGGVARYALDPANAQRLWAVSERLLAGG